MLVPHLLLSLGTVPIHYLVCVRVHVCNWWVCYNKSSDGCLVSSGGLSLYVFWRRNTIEFHFYASRVKNGNSVTTLQLTYFDDWFHFLGSFSENLAPKSLPKFLAFFIMPQNLKLLRRTLNCIVLHNITHIKTVVRINNLSLNDSKSDISFMLLATYIRHNNKTIYIIEASEILWWRTQYFSAINLVHSPLERMSLQQDYYFYAFIPLNFFQWALHRKKSRFLRL